MFLVILFGFNNKLSALASASISIPWKKTWLTNGCSRFFLISSRRFKKLLDVGKIGEGRLGQCHTRIAQTEARNEDPLRMTLIHVAQLTYLYPADGSIMVHGLTMGIIPFSTANITTPSALLWLSLHLPTPLRSLLCLLVLLGTWLPLLVQLKMLIHLINLLRMSLSHLAPLRILLLHPASQCTSQPTCLPPVPFIAFWRMFLHSHALPWTSHNPLAKHKRSYCLIALWSTLSHFAWLTMTPSRLYFMHRELCVKGGSFMVPPKGAEPNSPCKSCVFLCLV